jgi:hypothetical protein
VETGPLTLRLIQTIREMLQEINSIAETKPFCDLRLQSVANIEVDFDSLSFAII